MTYRPNRLGSLSLALLLSAGVAHAAEENYPSLDFNAYGTLSAVHSSDERADFVAHMMQPEGAGFSEDVAFGVDSRLGLQVSAVFTPKLSSVLQVVSEHQYDGSYSPVVEWANVKYDFTPDFSVRVGRIVLPTFIVSDYRKVGYANHWVRAPVEIYNLVPVTNNDGIDASYRMQFGRFTNTVQAFAGDKDLNMPMGKTLGRGGRGIFNTLEFGNTQLKLGYQRTKISAASLDGFFDLFRSFGPQGIAIADRYDLNNTPIETVVVGGRYDPGKWFAMAEWVRSSTPSFIGTSRAWYVTGGYRHGSLTPYATYSTISGLSNFHRERGLNLTGLPPALQGFGSSINAGLRMFLQSRDTETLAVGTRWDFAPNLSATLQLDHISAGADSHGSVINIQPGRMRGGSFNVVTAALSFVY